jgi:hypothetical protein
MGQKGRMCLIPRERSPRAMEVAASVLETGGHWR